MFNPTHISMIRQRATWTVNEAVYVTDDRFNGGVYLLPGKHAAAHTRHVFPLGIRHGKGEGAVLGDL